MRSTLTRSERWGAVTTGGQSTPDRGLDLPAGRGPVVAIRDLAETCGVESIWIVEAEDTEEQMRSVFRQALSREGFNMVIVRKPCQSEG